MSPEYRLALYVMLILFITKIVYKRYIRIRQNKLTLYTSELLKFKTTQYRKEPFMKIILTIAFLLFSQTNFAVNTWYWGKVTQILTTNNDGSYYVFVNNPNLISGCIHARVHYRTSDIGIETMKASMALALSALHSGKDFGVVVDMPATSSEICFAAGNSSQNSGIRL